MVNIGVSQARLPPRIIFFA